MRRSLPADAGTDRRSRASRRRHSQPMRLRSNPDHDSTLRFGVAPSGWCTSRMPQGGRRTVCLTTIYSQAWPTGTDPRPRETINLTRLAATVSGQEVSEAVVELIAEKLRIVGRATEDGSLGWKLLLQHVADDAKGASGNLAG